MGILYKYILTFAIIYENREFYLPTFMDFRGRLYCYTFYLSFQGCDLARSLIEFYDGCEINDDSLNTCLHFLGNTAGYNKLKISERINWSKES